ncbi:MAG TPA: TolC family outer membrane protein, partial [Polyangiales bacterium]|nr:TolC family outer membrane protein [Polyangiales bacterium]
TSDPTLAAAESTKYATDEDVPIARAPLLPQLNASLSYLRDDNINRGVSPQLVTTETDPVGNYVLFPYSTISKSRSRQAQGVLSQSIFNWGNIERLRQAHETAASSDSDNDTASQDLMVRTATAYFGVLTAEDQLKFAQLNEKSLLKQLDQAEQRYEVGLSAITDVHVARAQHDAAVAQVITAQNAVDTARESLVQITGKDFGDLKKLRDQLPLERPQPDAVQAWVDLANTSSPSIQSQQHLVEAAEHNVSAFRSGHLPTLSASVTRTDTPGWGTSNSSIPGEVVGNTFHTNSLIGDTTIGVTLAVPIFSGGLVTAQTRQAAFQRDTAKDNLELTRRTVFANTRNAYRAVIAGISEVEATRQAVVSAQSGLDATQAGFEVGTKTILDVLTSQSTLLNAQSAYSQARHQFVLSGLQLKDAAGILTGKDIEAVNALLERPS